MADGLVAAWLVAEGSGDVVRDYSGRENDATATSAPPWVGGPDGWARQFAVGDPDYLTCADALPITDFLTVTARVNVTNTNTNRVILDFRDGGNDGFVFWLRTNDRLELAWDTFDAASTSAVSQDSWHTFATTHDGDASILYEDAVVVGSNSGSGAGPVDVIVAARIGARSFTSATNSWSGSMSHIYVWDRALSQPEIARVTAFPFEMFEAPMLSWLQVAAAPPSASPDYYRRLTMNRQGRVA